MTTAFQQVIDRGRASLRSKCLRSIQSQAEPLFDAEVALIRHLNCEESLIQMVEYGDQLRQRNVNFHVIGSGASSVILFVLEMSEVHPTQHDTYFQRFWQTSSGESPILQIVTDSIGKPEIGEISPPSCVSVHPMTPLEAIPYRLELQVGTIKTFKLDQGTLESLQAGDTADVFQLHSDRARWLLSQIRPVNFEELACVSALEQISYTRPDVVINYLELYRGIITARYVTGRRNSTETRHLLPIVFQELLMSRLRRMAKLPWNDTYPFVRTAAKGKIDEQHDLWKSVLQAMKDNCLEDREPLLRGFVESSRWAVCRAHHIANALTSYKAAFYRTHHRMEFERVRMQITELAGTGE